MFVRLQNNKEQCYKYEDFLRFYTGEVNGEHIGKKLMKAILLLLVY